MNGPSSPVPQLLPPKTPLIRRAANALADPGRIWRGIRLSKKLRALRRNACGPMILFDRPGGIGDIICTFPAVLALRGKYPGCRIIYLTRHEFVPVVEMSGCADQVVGRDYIRGDPRITLRDFDLVFQPALTDERPPSDQPHKHLVDEFAEQVGVSLASRQPHLSPPNEQIASLAARLASTRRSSGPMIGIHIGPSWAVREWIPAHWNQLAAQLVTELQATVIQLGTDTDTARGRVGVERISGAVDWVNRLSLQETIAAIAGLDLLVGIDSGLLHIAGAVGTPTVGIFGPIDATLRLPPESPALGVAGNVPCLGCHHRLPRLHWITGCPYNIACMKTLDAQTVFDACKRRLAGAKLSGKGIKSGIQGA
jgi:ADP-heptose:LPS heptosyltransferase